jgi:hypothetical protein
MTITVEFIDQIVRTVLREMQSRTVSSQSAPNSTEHAQQSADGSAELLRIHEPVVTEAVLVHAGAADRAISLIPGAVLTPSGRDYVRKNNIRLSSSVSRASRSVSPSTKHVAEVQGLLIALPGSAIAVSSAAAAGWGSITVQNDSEAAAKAAELARVRSVVCFGGEASLVACLLNRNAAIRAAVIESSTDLTSLNQVMAPNVLCLNSLGWSFGSLLRLMRTWNRNTSGGIR